MLHAAVGRVDCTDPTEGEAATLKMGIIEALKRGFTLAIVEGDLLQVTDALKAFPKKSDWSIHHVINCF